MPKNGLSPSPMTSSCIRDQDVISKLPSDRTAGNLFQLSPVSLNIIGVNEIRNSRPPKMSCRTFLRLIPVTREMAITGRSAAAEKWIWIPIAHIGKASAPHHGRRPSGTATDRPIAQPRLWTGHLGPNLARKDDRPRIQGVQGCRDDGWTQAKPSPRDAVTCAHYECID